MKTNNDYTEPWVIVAGVGIITLTVFWLFGLALVEYIDQQYDHCPDPKQYTTIEKCKEGTWKIQSSSTTGT